MQKVTLLVTPVDRTAQQDTAQEDGARNAGDELLKRLLRLQAIKEREREETKKLVDKSVEG